MTASRSKDVDDVFNVTCQVCGRYGAPSGLQADPNNDCPECGFSSRVRIDPEFRDICPPLTDDEREGLEAALLADGVREPLVTWKGLLADGHHRYAICMKHRLPFHTTALDAEDREAVITWIVKNALSRRNLTDYQQSELALRLKPGIAAKARERQRTSTGGAKPQLLTNSSEAAPVSTRKAIAEAAGVSENTIAKVEAIVEHADEPTKQALRRGETSINKVHGELTGKRRKDDVPGEKKPRERRVAATPDGDPGLMEMQFWYLYFRSYRKDVSKVFDKWYRSVRKDRAFAKSEYERLQKRVNS